MEYLWMIVAAVTAGIMGRNIIGWGLLGFLVGWPAFVLVACLKSKSITVDEVKQIIAEQEKKEKPEGYEDFDNVYDLFKQLEKK